MSDDTKRQGIKYNQMFPETYLTLMPKELAELLSAYYYGPLEVRYFHHSNDPFLNIKEFDNNNRLKISFTIIISIVELLTAHDNSLSGVFDPKKESKSIRWSTSYINLSGSSSSVLIYDYKAELFWIKLRHIVDKLMGYVNEGLDHRTIGHEFYGFIF